MRVFGIILVVFGILMMFINGFNFKTKENVVDLGPLEVNKTENNPVVWPSYAGVVVCVAGIAFIAFGKKKS